LAVNVSLAYGNKDVHAVVSGGRMIGEIRPNPVPEVADLRQETINGLRCPIGSEPLNALAQDAGKVAIVISDHTRTLPSGLLLPVVLSELEQAGLKKDAVTVVIGGGSHRPVTEEEKRRLLGPLYRQVKCFHSRETSYVMIGITKRGTPVEVAAPVAEAGLVVALGNIELHQLAGYSGGVKAVAAGTASPRALDHNHRLSTLPGGGLGVLDENVVRRDMEEFARIAGLRFIINVVLNEHNRVVSLVAGDPVKAHLTGCAVAERMYGVKIREAADIVIASPGGSPRDDTVYQAQKSVNNALKAVTEGGIIVVAAKCGEGFGDPEFAQWMNKAASPGDIEERARREFLLGGHKAAFVARAVKKARIFWVSDMEPEKVRKLFFEPYGSLQEAVDSALRIKGDEAGIVIMPRAGLTVPGLEI